MKQGKLHWNIKKMYLGTLSKSSWATVCAFITDLQSFTDPESISYTVTGVNRCLAVSTEEALLKIVRHNAVLSFTMSLKKYKRPACEASLTKTIQ